MIDCNVEDINSKETEEVSGALAEFVIALVSQEIADLKLPVFFEG